MTIQFEKTKAGFQTVPVLSPSLGISVSALAVYAPMAGRSTWSVSAHGIFTWQGFKDAGRAKQFAEAVAAQYGLVVVGQPEPSAADVAQLGKVQDLRVAMGYPK